MGVGYDRLSTIVWKGKVHRYDFRVGIQVREDEPVLEHVGSSKIELRRLIDGLNVCPLLGCLWLSHLAW
jgi:hypothetical protein